MIVICKLCGFAADDDNYDMVQHLGNEHPEAWWAAINVAIAEKLIPSHERTEQ
jgi:hypothetical protein